VARRDATHPPNCIKSESEPKFDPSTQGSILQAE
jgi:hypothetical protein